MIELKPSSPPDLNRVERALDFRLPYHHPDVPLIALWSHKAGCTILLRWYLFQCELLREAIETDRGSQQMRLHQYERDVFKAREGYRDDLMKAFEQGKPAICFIRCPYQRAFSSYLQINNPKLLEVRARGQQNRLINLREAFLQTIHGRAMDFATPMAFIDYLQALRDTPKFRANRHHSPQHSHLHDRCEVNYFRLEQMATVAETMERDLDLRTSYRHERMFKSNHSVPKQRVDAKQLDEMLARGVDMQRSRQDAVPAVNRELLSSRPEGSLIEELFSRDIALYDSTALL